MKLIQPFIEAQQNRIAELADLRQTGRKVVGFFCLHTSAALIEAAGGIPLRLCLQGDAMIQRSGARHARSCLCPFIKACLGYMAAGHPWFSNIDAIAAGSTCDQMRHLADIYRLRFQIPTYIFFQPRGRESTGTYWIYQQELQWLFRELSAFCELQLNQSEIHTVIERYNLIQYYLHALHHMRAGGNPPLSGADWFTVVQAGFVLSSQRYLDLLRQLLGQITKAKLDARAALRIMLLGGMHAQGEERIVRAIEDAGQAIIITDALCTGTRVIGPQIACEGDLLANLIRAQYTKVPCIHTRPNLALYDYIEQQIKQFRVDGVVFHTLKFCDGWGSEWLRMQQFLKRRNIPNIVLDTDYGAADTGQIATRVDAFLEMLQAQKAGDNYGV